MRTYYCEFLCHWDGTEEGFLGLVGPFPSAALAKAWPCALREASRAFNPGTNGVLLIECFRASFVSSAANPAFVAKRLPSHMARGLSPGDLAPSGAYAKLSFVRDVTRTEMYCGPFTDDDEAMAWIAIFEREAEKNSRLVVGTDLTGPPPLYPATTTATELVTQWGAVLSALRSEQKDAVNVAENRRA